MLENKFGELFDESDVPPLPAQPAALPALLPKYGALVALCDIYQMAYELALRDHELDLLFNPNDYGDFGLGI